MMLRILAVVTVTSICLLALLLVATSPASIGLLGMLAVFLLGYLSLLGVVTFLLYYGAKLWISLAGQFSRRVIRIDLTLGRAYLYASVLSALPMMAIGLHSTGGIAWYEAVLLLVFGAIGVLYVARRT